LKETISEVTISTLQARFHYLLAVAAMVEFLSSKAMVAVKCITSVEELREFQTEMPLMGTAV
jgi:hypothetical protein